MDTLPFLRRTIEAAGLEDAVIAVVGDSPTVARHWGTPVGLLFIDGGHALDVAMADYEAWARFVLPGGLLAIHDVFESPADGGQAPFVVWQRAVADGFDAGVDDRQPAHPAPPLTVEPASRQGGRRCPGPSRAEDRPLGGQVLAAEEAGGRARRRRARARPARPRRCSTSAGRP